MVAETLSGFDGRFALASAEASAVLETRDPRWVAVRTGVWHRDATLEPLLVLAPRIELSGLVVDEWGRAVSGARVSLVLPAALEARVGQVLDATRLEHWESESDASGRFQLAGAPALSGAQLSCVHAEYAARTQPAPLAERRDLWLELRRAEDAVERPLRGRVLRAGGEPASDALVFAGRAVATTDAGGAFMIDLARAGDCDELVAAEPGLLPARYALGEGERPDYVELRLQSACASLRGRVVDEDGRPRAGARVWVADPELLGYVGSVPVQLEAWLAGGALPAEALESLDRSVSVGADGVYGSASPALAPDAVLSWVESDADGRFELSGLSGRAVRLAVLGPGLDWGALLEDVRPGPNELLVVTRDSDVHARLRARLVDESGAGLAGVRVTPWIGAFHHTQVWEDASVDVLRFFLRASVSTDADGWFELENAPRRELQLHLISDAILPSYIEVEQLEVAEGATIEVERRAHVRVLLEGEWAEADAVRLLDAEGRALTLYGLHVDGYSNLNTLPIDAGRSGVFSVSPAAVELELLRAGASLGSFELELRPGELTTFAR